MGGKKKCKRMGILYYIFRFDIQNSGSITLMPTKYYKPNTPEDIEKNKRRTTRPFVYGIVIIWPDSPLRKTLMATPLRRNMGLPQDETLVALSSLQV